MYKRSSACLPGCVDCFVHGFAAYMAFLTGLGQIASLQGRDHSEDTTKAGAAEAEWPQSLGHSAPRCIGGGGRAGGPDQAAGDCRGQAAGGEQAKAKGQATATPSAEAEGGGGAEAEGGGGGAAFDGECTAVKAVQRGDLVGRQERGLA